MTIDAESGLPPAPSTPEPPVDDDPTVIRADIARELRQLADTIEGGPVSIQGLVRGRHFAPYGSDEALCGVPVAIAPVPSTGEYSDDRYTVMRARTTCGSCLAQLVHATDEAAR